MAKDLSLIFKKFSYLILLSTLKLTQDRVLGKYLFNKSLIYFIGYFKFIIWLK